MKANLTTQVGREGWNVEGKEQRLATLLDWLQLGVVCIVLGLCFRARGHHGVWLALALFLPLMRLALAAEYRRRILNGARRLWQSLPADLSNYDRVPWLATAVLVTLPTACLFLANSRSMGVGDSWPVIPTACSLVTEGNLDLVEQIAAAPPVYTLVSATDVPCCTRRVGGHIFSGYPSGMVPFALPVVALARLVGADLHSPRTHERLEKFTAAWVAAASVGLFFLLALHLTTPTPALASTLLLAVGSALFSTCGQALWQQGGVIFWMLVVLFVEFRRSVRPVRGGTWLQGVACAMMLACRLSASLLVVSFGAWVLVREPRRAVRVALAAAVAFVPWAILHASLYGTPLGPSVGLLAREAWFGTVSEGLKGVLFSPARGLFVYQPWLLGGLAFSLFLWMRRRCPGAGPAGWGWFCLTATALHLALIGTWGCWWGGHCWGSRLTAEIVPLLALLCVPAVAQLISGQAGRLVLALLVVLSFALHASAVFKHADNWNNYVNWRNPAVLWSWSHAPFMNRGAP